MVRRDLLHASEGRNEVEMREFIKHHGSSFPQNLSEDSLSRSQRALQLPEGWQVAPDVDPMYQTETSDRYSAFVRAPMHVENEYIMPEEPIHEEVQEEERFESPVEQFDMGIQTSETSFLPKAAPFESTYLPKKRAPSLKKPAFAMYGSGNTKPVNQRVHMASFNVNPALHPTNPFLGPDIKQQFGTQRVHTSTLTKLATDTSHYTLNTHMKTCDLSSTRTRTYSPLRVTRTPQHNIMMIYEAPHPDSKLEVWQGPETGYGTRDASTQKTAMEIEESLLALKQELDKSPVSLDLAALTVRNSKYRDVNSHRYYSAVRPSSRIHPIYGRLPDESWGSAPPLWKTRQKQILKSVQAKPFHPGRKIQSRDAYLRSVGKHPGTIPEPEPESETLERHLALRNRFLRTLPTPGMTRDGLPGRSYGRGGPRAHSTPAFGGGGKTAAERVREREEALVREAMAIQGWSKERDLGADHRGSDRHYHHASLRGTMRSVSMGASTAHGHNSYEPAYEPYPSPLAASTPTPTPTAAGAATVTSASTQTGNGAGVSESLHWEAASGPSLRLSEYQASFLPAAPSTTPATAAQKSYPGAGATLRRSIGTASSASPSSKSVGTPAPSGLSTTLSATRTVTPPATAAAPPPQGMQPLAANAVVAGGGFTLVPDSTGLMVPSGTVASPGYVVQGGQGYYAVPVGYGSGLPPHPILLSPSPVRPTRSQKRLYQQTANSSNQIRQCLEWEGAGVGYRDAAVVVNAPATAPIPPMHYAQPIQYVAPQPIQYVVQHLDQQPQQPQQQQRQQQYQSLPLPPQQQEQFAQQRESCAFFAPLYPSESAVGPESSDKPVPPAGQRPKAPSLRASRTTTTTAKPQPLARAAASSASSNIPAPNTVANATDRTTRPAPVSRPPHSGTQGSPTLAASHLTPPELPPATSPVLIKMGGHYVSGVRVEPAPGTGTNPFSPPPQVAPTPDMWVPHPVLPKVLHPPSKSIAGMSAEERSQLRESIRKQKQALLSSIQSATRQLASTQWANIQLNAAHTATAPLSPPNAYPQGVAGVPLDHGVPTAGAPTYYATDMTSFPSAGSTSGVFGADLSRTGTLPPSLAPYVLSASASSASSGTSLMNGGDNASSPPSQITPNAGSVFPIAGSPTKAHLLPKQSPVVVFPTEASGVFSPIVTD